MSGLLAVGLTLCAAFIVGTIILVIIVKRGACARCTHLLEMHDDLHGCLAGVPPRGMACKCPQYTGR